MGESGRIRADDPRWEDEERELRTREWETEGDFTEDRASSWGRGGYERWERTDQREWRQKEKNWEEFEGKDLVEGGAEQETRTVSLGDREIDD